MIGSKPASSVYSGESAYAKSEGEVPNGWTVDGNRIIVWEPRDAFGRRGFDWEDVPPL